MLNSIYSKILSPFSKSSFEIAKKSKMLLSFNLLMIILTVSTFIVGLIISKPVYLLLSGFMAILWIISTFILSKGKFEISANITILGFMIIITAFKIFIELDKGSPIFWYIAGVFLTLITTSLIGYKLYQPLLITVIGVLGVLSSIFTIPIPLDKAVLIEIEPMDIIMVSIVTIAGGIIAMFLIKINTDMVNIAKTETEKTKKKFTMLKDIIKTSNKSMQIGENLVNSTKKTLDIIDEINNNFMVITEDFINLSEHMKKFEGNNQKIVSVTADVKSIISEQSTVISETSASIEEMTQSINNISDIAKNKQKAIHQLEVTTKEGEEEMNRAITSINKISESVTNILSVINVIVDLADQTNLLAMNASIESARAGQSGTGFSVVASEIRKLAETTTHQTKIITDKLNADIEQINESVEINKRAGEQFHKVNDEVHTVVYAIEEIINGMTELSAGTNQIMKAVNNLIDMAEKTDNSAKEMERLINSNKEDIQNIVSETETNKSKLEEILMSFSDIINETEKINEIGKENIEVIENLEEELMNIDKDNTNNTKALP
jgi:methyl-accepting chemotaxis protein